eukprot:4650336-Pyramimonas_sp.AAC.3
MSREWLHYTTLHYTTYTTLHYTPMRFARYAPRVHNRAPTRRSAPLSTWKIRSRRSWIKRGLPRCAVVMILFERWVYSHSLRVYQAVMGSVANPMR